MDYLEIEGKAQLERYGIRTNGGVILEGDAIPEEVTFPCVLKGQIQAGHRGQHGAVSPGQQQGCEQRGAAEGHGYERRHRVGGTLRAAGQHAGRREAH